MKVSVSSTAFQAGYATGSALASSYIATGVLAAEPYNPYTVESEQFQWDAGYKTAFTQRQIVSRKVLEIGGLGCWTPPKPAPIVDVQLCSC